MSVDLSGSWRGIFNYPSALPPTEFEAELRDSGGAISGVTTEPRLDGGAVLHATLEGAREGSRVRFLKIYDDPGDAYRAVRYDGAIDPSGDEIEGRWTIAGAWSGTFIMIRASGAGETAEQKASERV